MSEIFISDVHTSNEMKNLAFYRKLHASALAALVDPSNPFAMYGFQGDEAGLVGSLNEGTSGVLGNMAWTNIGLRTGQGWYAPHRGWGSSGMRGFGMVNDGGGSGFVGSVADHSGNNAGGAVKLTVIATFLATSAGEGGLGRIIDKNNGYRLRFSAANTIIFEVWDGAAWRGSTTGATVVYGFWRTLTCVYDGTLAAADRIKMYLDGKDVTVPGANIPATITDAANIMYVLDNAGNANAWSGLLGALVTAPKSALTLAQAQGFVEMRAGHQPIVANQSPIITPGHWDWPEYDLDGAADPNSDHFRTYQVSPIKTQQGTLLYYFSPDDFTLSQTIFALSTDGITDDEFRVDFRGADAGDPLEIFHHVNGVLSWRGVFGANLINPNINFLAMWSNGTIVRAAINGAEQVITDVVGVNSGQWFGDATDANVFAIGCLVRATLVQPYDGKYSKLVIRDDPTSSVKIAQLQQQGSWRPRYA